MVDYFHSLENEHVIRWYDEHCLISNINGMAKDLESRGYTADPKSGLFFRKLFSEEFLQKMSQTIIDVGFLRPTDVHFHEDVNEFVKVIGGKGYVFSKYKGEISTPDISSFNESEVEIPKGRRHAFSPSRNGFLELRVVCDGILDSNKEHCVTPFYEFEDWEKVHGKRKN
ncbi:MAG: hypothetical protein AABW63_01240 [Nanoarchaeota archaeon]